MEEEENEGARAARFADGAVQAGFTPVPNVILVESGLTMPARMCYVALASFAWGPKDDCFPGNESLAERMGCHVNTVVKAKKELVEARLLEVRRRGLNRTNVYLLTLKAPGTTPRVDQQPPQAWTKKTRIKQTRSDGDPADHAARPSRLTEEDRAPGGQSAEERNRDAPETFRESKVTAGQVEDRVLATLAKMRHTPGEMARVAEAMGVDDALRLVDRSPWKAQPDVALAEMLRALYTTTIRDKKAWCAAFLRNGPRTRARWPGGLPVLPVPGPTCGVDAETDR